MVSLWSYTVTHYDKDNGWASQDLTNDVVAIPSFTDAGTEEFSTAILKVSANKGKYIKTGGGATVIKDDDRIRIQVNDGQSGTYDKYFNVEKHIPLKSKEEGATLQLKLKGIEMFLDEVNYSKPIEYDLAINVIDDIGDSYNVNRGTLMPVLSGHDDVTKILIPKTTANSYPFGINEDRCYTRILQVLDKLGQSVDAGGQLDFYEVKFVHTGVNAIEMRIVSSGSTGTGVVITNSTGVNVGDSEGGIESPTGTVINGWGAPDRGSLPVDFSKFKSKELRYSLYPQWDSTLTYSQNSRVQYLGSLYKSLQNNNTNKNPTTQPAFWSVQTRATDYGNVLQYSPWTVGKAQLWKNSGADPSGTLSRFSGAGGIGTVAAACMWDSNLVIWDTVQGVFRTWADIKGINRATMDSKYFYGGTAEYVGMRLLVNGSGLGALSGSDSNGVSRQNAIVEWTGTEWRVKYSAQTNLRVAILEEGRTYKFNGAAWVDDSATTVDCWHPYDSITNVTGVINAAGFTINNNSAIRFRYRFNTADVLSTNNTQRYGAWACFRFPFPHNTTGGISEGVGELYGGTISSKVPYLDAQNMHLTHDGKRGFNQGSSSEDFGQINALEFWGKLGFTTDATGAGGYTTHVGMGNFNMRCIMYDFSDNIVFQDFVFKFNETSTGGFESIKLPLAGFAVYRARKPLANPADGIIPPKQLDVQNEFEWRHIKQIVIQTQDSFDSEGRYSPTAVTYQPSFAQPILPDGNAHFFRQIDLTIDGFRFTKPLLVNSGIVTDLVREPDFIEKPDIGDYYQLQGDVFSELEKARYRKTLFDVTTTGKFDVGFGDTFYFTDDEIVNFSDNGANTVKLVAKKITYSITKPKDGQGGFLRTINGSRRFI